MNDLYTIHNKSNVDYINFLHKVIDWNDRNNDDTLFMIWDKDDKIILMSEKLKGFSNQESEVESKWFHYLPNKKTLEIKEHFKHSVEKLHIPCIKYKMYNHEELLINAYSCLIDILYYEEEVFFICKLTDITNLNQLKDIILDTEKILSAAEFAAGLVHEIRNPLTSLKGFIQLAQAGIDHPEKYYDVMISEVEKLEKITTELLYIAKPYENTFAITSINEMIDDVLFLLNNQSNMNDIQIMLNVESELKIKCNASQIKQIFINLFKNGIEAMSMNGVLKINVYQNNDVAIIDVIDEGEGIPVDKIKELNKPFYTTKDNGTGLGLMITQHILDLHDAKLEVYSENKQTIFRLIFDISL